MSNTQSARSRIQSRKPTGKVTWPTILLEGDEGSGKTYTAYEFTKSEKIGASFVIDLGEGSSDEYAPIGDYEIIEHDGTFSHLLDQVTAVHEFAGEELEAGNKPVCLVIDNMAMEWDGLRDGITAKAAKSEKNRKLLREDPAAEVRVPNHLWNDANAKHRRLMTKLLTFPGVVILTSKGKEVAEIRNGAPVEGSKVWKVEGQKDLAYDASAVIRMKRDSGATLQKARSLYCGVRPGIDAARKLPDDWTLEWFVFEALRLNPENAHVRDLRDMGDNGEPMHDGDAPADQPQEQQPDPRDQAAAQELVDEAAQAVGVTEVQAVIDKAEKARLMGVQVTLGGNTGWLGNALKYLLKRAHEWENEAHAQDSQGATDQHAEESPGQAEQRAQEDNARAEQPQGAREDAQGTRAQNGQAREQGQEQSARLTGKQKLVAAAEDELAFQAGTLSVSYSEHIAGLVKDTPNGKVSDVTQQNITRWVTGQRERVVAALRQQGKATLANVYARAPFPVSMEDVFERADQQASTREREPAHA